MFQAEPQGGEIARGHVGWTDDRIATLKRMWEDGASCSIIAKALGKGATRNAVIGKVHRMGLCGRGTIIRKKPKRGRSPWNRNRRDSKHDKFAAKLPRTKPSIIDLLPKTPLPPPSVTDVARVTIHTLDAHHCRWPISATPSASAHGYCGCKAIPGMPYCEDHARRAFRPPAVRNTVRVYQPHYAMMTGYRSKEVAT
jgi:GcrA cell cycle regulator